MGMVFFLVKSKARSPTFHSLETMYTQCTKCTALASCHVEVPVRVDDLENGRRILAYLDPLLGGK